MARLRRASWLALAAMVLSYGITVAAATAEARGAGASTCACTHGSGVACPMHTASADRSICRWRSASMPSALSVFAVMASIDSGSTSGFSIDLAPQPSQLHGPLTPAEQYVTPPIAPPPRA